MDWGDSWPFGLCGLFPAIDWQARALAAERELAELRTSPAYHDPGLQRRLLAAESERDALSLEYATYRQDAAGERDELRTRVAALVRAAREVVAVAKGERAIGLEGFLLQVGDTATFNAQIGLLKTAMHALAALLDAPLWRDLR